MYQIVQVAFLVMLHLWNAPAAAQMAITATVKRVCVSCIVLMDYLKMMTILSVSKNAHQHNSVI